MNTNDYDMTFGPSSMSEQSSYLYTYNCHETERALCLMELTELFGQEPDGADWLESERRVDPIAARSYQPALTSR